MCQLPISNLEFIRINEHEILEILCDFFLENNPATFDTWEAHLLEKDNKIEFVAVFGTSKDPLYKVITEAAFADSISSSSNN